MCRGHPVRPDLPSDETIRAPSPLPLERSRPLTPSILCGGARAALVFRVGNEVAKIELGGAHELEMLELVAHARAPHVLLPARVPRCASRRQYACVPLSPTVPCCTVAERLRCICVSAA